MVKSYKSKSVIKFKTKKQRIVARVTGVTPDISVSSSVGVYDKSYTPRYRRVLINWDLIVVLLCMIYIG